MTAPRVAVTTTPDAAGRRLSRLLAEARLQPVVLPCIRIEPAPFPDLERARRLAAGAEWLVITSRRSVDVLWPSGGMPDVPAVAVVGSSTARAVRSAGGRPIVVGAGGAASLRALMDGRLTGAAVCFPHARAADPETIAWLEARAGEVTAVPVYDTVPVGPGDDPVEAVMFGSPSAVMGWMMTRSLVGAVVAAIGPTTAAYLRTLGHPPRVVTARPRVEDLVADLARHLGAGGEPT